MMPGPHALNQRPPTKKRRGGPRRQATIVPDRESARSVRWSRHQISKPRPKSSALIAISGSAPASMAALWARVRGTRRW